LTMSSRRGVDVASRTFSAVVSAVMAPQ
jgi:hypothetical protein